MRRDVEALYAADPRTGFRICPLDSLTAYYHRRSGVTHVVADPVPQILTALHGTPLSLEALLAHLVAADGLIITEDSKAALAERLEELCTIGLVLRI
ncbi:MAG: HPr-rel-A system PqqD family peptide chaperone [Chakrabartia sp.]